MQNFSNGRARSAPPAENATPADEYDDDLIQELADKIGTLARRAGGGGMRVDFDWLADALDDNELALHVLRRAGFRQMPDMWAIGRGNSTPSTYGYPPCLARELEEIVDYYS